jgi:hypothetical protein
MKVKYESGTRVDNDAHQVSCWWLSESEKMDFSYASKIGQWTRSNNMGLRKMRPSEVAKHYLEQFPLLTAVEVRDTMGRLGRVSR